MMVKQSNRDDQSSDPLRVLVVDNDEDVIEVVSAILTDEGYAVTAMGTVDHGEIASAVGRLEPDCILLDGADGLDFGESWAEAAYLSTRSRSVPVVMFTAHAAAADEARAATSDRARAAGFAAILSKPFSLDEMLETVATATGRSERFDRSEAADSGRTQALVEQLQTAGALNIRPSQFREWATFATPLDARIRQLYWWQRFGAYIVGVYNDDARLERLGKFHARRDAIAAALR